MSEKRCPRCGEWKSLDDFGRNKSRKDGHQVYCRPCYSEYLKTFKRGWRKTRNQPISVESKICTKCGETKPTAEFAGNRTEADGLTSWCRECRNAHTRDYFASGRGAESAARSSAKFPERIKARKAVNHAVERGELPKVSECACVDCGAQADEYHHESYAPEDWLTVDPLCSRCHGMRHRRPEGVMPSVSAKARSTEAA